MSARTLTIEDSRRTQWPHEIQAIRNLWAAVLKVAADDLRSKNIASYTWRWFQSENKGPGSFRWICGLLNLGVEQTRAALELKLYRNPKNHNPMGLGGRRANATHP